MHMGVATEPEERPSKHFVARLLVIFEEQVLYNLLDKKGGIQYSLVKNVWGYIIHYALQGYRIGVQYSLVNNVWMGGGIHYS